MKIAFTKNNLVYYLVFSIFLLNLSWFFFDRAFIGSTYLSIARFLAPLILIMVLKKLALSYKARFFIILLSVYYVIGNILAIANPEIKGFSKYFPSGLSYILTILAIFSVDRNLLILSTKAFIYFFKFVIILSFIEFLLLSLDFNMPYDTLNLNERVLFYRRYWLLIVCEWLIYPINGFIFTRFNGPFEEPGMLGTYAGILIFIEYYLTKRKFHWTHLIYFFTFSFAFYFAYILYFLYVSNMKNKIKVALFSIPFIYLFMPIIKWFIVARFDINNLLGESRGQFVIKFNEYVQNSSIKSLLLGNGIGSNRINEEAQFASYHQFIYEGGYIGFVFLLLALVILLIPSINKDKFKLYYSLTLLGLIWQRPEFFSTFYIITFCLVFFYENKANNINSINH